jgi:hypothetical protein
MNTKLNKILLLAIVIISALALFLKSNSVVWTADECMYAFKLNENPTGLAAITGEKIETITDAFLSQCNQYYTGNGRLIVHFFTQMFSGPWGKTVFSICNLFLFICVLYSFMHLTIHESNRKNGIIWFILCLGILYLFPEPDNLWYVPAMSMNYLLTMFTSIIFFLLYKKIIEDCNLSKLKVIFIAIFSFVAGWMNEAYTIPISGALFLWLIINRNRINTHVVLVTAAFWLGTLALIVGNLGRANSVSHIYIALYAIDLYAKLKIVWITIIACFIFRLKCKIAFIEFIKDNIFYVFMLAVSVILSFIFNTTPRSLIGVEFSSFIILLKLIDLYFKSAKSHRHILIISLFGTLLIAVHQSFIISDFKCVHDETMKMVEDAKHNTEGVAKIPDIKFSAMTRPYVYNWMNPHEPKLDVWHSGCISRYYLNGKPFFPLKEKDYNAITCPEKFFVEKNRMPGNVLVYRGDKYYWMCSTDIPLDSTLVCEYEKVRFEDAGFLALGVWYLICPDKYPSKDIIVLPDSVEIKNNKGLFMFRKGRFHERSFSYLQPNKCGQ